MTSGTTGTLNSVFFIDANIGYVVGYNSNAYRNSTEILKTTNAGQNWFAQATGTNYKLQSVYFIDANTGYAVGGFYPNPIILKTTNGVTNWTTQVSVTTSPLYSVFFTDANTGYVSGPGIRKTTDGGANWVSQTGGSITSLFFRNSNIGYAVGENGIIPKTTNGGSWIGKITGNNDEINIFPNPAVNNITIEYAAVRKLNLTIYNIYGEQIMQKTLTAYKNVIDISALSKGIYMIKLVCPEFSVQRKLIKN